jgi:hypothetical protein
LGKKFDAEDLSKLLASLKSLLDFHPARVIIDGFRCEALQTLPFQEIAQEHQLRIWMAVRIHRNSLPARNYVNGFSTAVELVPEQNNVELHLLRLGNEIIDEPPVLHLDPVTMILRPEDVKDPITTPPSPSPAQCTLFSGGALGSEAYFGEAAERWGIKEKNFTFADHNQKRTRGQHVLSDRELAAGSVSLAYVSRRLHRHWDRTPLLRKVLQLLWHMVSHADQVFVIGAIQPDNTVHGGTGWSVELARRWHKPIWVFDQDKEAWFYWEGSSWKTGKPVIASPNFAGSGTRFLNPAGKKAIDDLFSRSFG